MNGDCLGIDNLTIHDAISRIHFAPASNNLLISSWDSKLRLYDVDSSLLRLEVDTDGAATDCCFQNESVAFSSGVDCTILRYDLHSGFGNTIGMHEDMATCVEYSQDTGQLLSAGWDKKIMSWDTRMKKTVGHSIFFGAKVESMCLLGFNLTVASSTSIHMFDLRNINQPVQANELPMNLQIRCVRSIPDSRGFAVGSVDGRVALKMFNPTSPDNTGYAFRCYPKTGDGRYYFAAVNDIVFNPSSRGSFVTGNNEGYVTAWDAQCKRSLFELPRYPNSIASLAYNYEGKLLAVASSYTYQGENEIEEPPRIYVHRLDGFILCWKLKKEMTASGCLNVKGHEL